MVRRRERAEGVVGLPLRAARFARKDLLEWRPPWRAAFRPPAVGMVVREMILAGDIGGTKTALALFARRREFPGFARAPAILATYDSRAFSGFDEILHDFCDRHRPKLRAGCIGIAGPVRANRCAATNLPWTLDGGELARALGLGELTLLNDLEAVGYGIDLLRADEIRELQAGADDPVGNRAVIAAGTGLGEAGLFWDGFAHRPFATEGGHADFAPRNELEIELLRFLQREHGRVSWERVVSGPGLSDIYRFLSQSGAFALADEPPEISGEMQQGDPAAAISRHAAAGKSALCARTLELFVELYAAEAGNLALKLMATGGLYIGGGIVPKNLDRIVGDTFVESFCAKGRMRPLLESIPVRVLLNEQTALLGAARHAAESLR